jgi:hypothetical protein
MLPYNEDYLPPDSRKVQRAIYAHAVLGHTFTVTEMADSLGCNRSLVAYCANRLRGAKVLDVETKSGIRYFRLSKR